MNPRVCRNSLAALLWVAGGGVDEMSPSEVKMAAASGLCLVSDGEEDEPPDLFLMETPHAGLDHELILTSRAKTDSSVSALSPFHTHTRCPTRRHSDSVC